MVENVASEVIWRRSGEFEDIVVGIVGSLGMRSGVDGSGIVTFVTVGTAGRKGNLAKMGFRCFWKEAVKHSWLSWQYVEGSWQQWWQWRWSSAVLAAKAIWPLVEVGLASSSSHGGLVVVKLLVYPQNLSSCQVRIDSWKMVIVQLKTTCNYKRKKKDTTVNIKMFKRSLIRTKKATFFFQCGYICLRTVLEESSI